MRYLNINEGLSGRALIEYTRNFSNIDQEIFAELCRMDPKTVVNGDQIINIGPWAKQLLIPNFLKGESDFMSDPDAVKQALEKYIPNIAKYPKPAEFKSVADFLAFMENPESANIETIAQVKDDPITAAYKKYYSEIDRDTFDKLIALDPDTKKDRIGEVARNLILPKYLAGDKSALSVDEKTLKDVLNIFYKAKEDKIYSQDDLNFGKYKTVQDFCDYVLKGPDSSFITALKSDDWSFNLPDHRYSGRVDERTGNTIDKDIDFIGATSQYNILSPKSQLANFAISGGYQVNNGNHWCTSKEIDNGRQYFGYWDNYQHGGDYVYVDFMRKGHERGTENRKYNWQLNINPKTGEIEHFLDGHDGKGNIAGDTASKRFTTFLLQNPDLIPVIKNSKYFINSPSVADAEKVLSNISDTLEINSLTDLAKVSIDNTDNYELGILKALTKKVILRNIEKIPAASFTKFKTLSEVVFEGNALKKIGAEAFKNCPISKIEFPDGLEEIGDQAFAGCALHGSIKLPDSLTKIGSQAFMKNSGYRLKLDANRSSRLKIDPADRDWAITYISVIN